METILVIDQSTSGTKAVLFDETGECRDRESLEHRQIYPRPGWVEHDLEEIWTNTQAVVRKLAARQRQAMAALSCVSLTNQRETVAVFERGTGRPLGHAMVWQCRRGEPICRELLEAGYGPGVTERTGLRLDTYFSASKLKWWVRADPGLAAKLAGGAALVGTMDTYLIYRMTEGRVWATDPTNACRTLWYDIGKLGWDPWLCELFEVPAVALPEIRESWAEFGATSLGGVLPRAVPIRGVMGDSQASLFAHRCYAPGMAKVTLGTGSSVLLNLGGNLRHGQGGTVTTLAWVNQGQPTYAFEGIINFSAAVVSWLKDRLGLLQSSAEAGQVAASVPDNGGVYLVPAFAGLGAPHWRPEARAAIVGLTAHSTREHVVRAGEESIAYQVRDVLEMMRGEAAVSLNSIRADGGPTRDRFLMQFMADMLGLEVEAAELPEGSALGAAMAGMLGCGWYRDLEALSKLPRARVVYRPGMDRALVTRYAAEWAAAVRRVL